MANFLLPFANFNQMVVFANVALSNSHMNFEAGEDYFDTLQTCPFFYENNLSTTERYSKAISARTV